MAELQVWQPISHECCTRSLKDYNSMPWLEYGSSSTHAECYMSCAADYCRHQQSPVASLAFGGTLMQGRESAVDALPVRKEPQQMTTGCTTVLCFPAAPALSRSTSQAACII